MRSVTIPGEMLLNQLVMGKNPGTTDKKTEDGNFGLAKTRTDTQVNSLRKEAAHLIVSRFLYP